MKKLIFLSAIVFLSFTTMISSKSIVRSSVNTNYFITALDGHGEWIEIEFNEFVFKPYDTNYSWRPYSDGRWEWTRHGWYWVSYEPYGWATYHYGRWFHDDYYGWVWMPDNVWAPAWVEWRYNDNYIGWAPLPPYARFNHSSGIHFSISWHSDHIYWNFVTFNHFDSRDIHYHYVKRSYIPNIYKRTKYRTNYFVDNKRIVNGGINRRFVEKRMGRKLVTRTISTTNNYKHYKTKSRNTGRAIVKYSPTLKEVNRNVTINKTKIKKGRKLNKLQSDKIIINKNKRTIKKTKNSNVQRKVISKSNNEIKNNKSKSSRNRNYKKNRSTKSNSQLSKRILKNKSQSRNVEIKKKTTVNKSIVVKETSRKKTKVDRKPTIKKEIVRKSKVSNEVKSNRKSIKSSKSKSRNSR